MDQFSMGQNLEDKSGHETLNSGNSITTFD
jgi:hypothetical protein